LTGEILEAPRGSCGFGYDPVFYLPALEKTFAELPAEEKNQLSHRGKAFRRLLAALAPCYSFGSYAHEIQEETIEEEATCSGKIKSGEIRENSQACQVRSCSGNGSEARGGNPRETGRSVPECDVRVENTRMHFNC